MKKTLILFSLMLIMSAVSAQKPTVKAPKDTINVPLSKRPNTMVQQQPKDSIVILAGADEYFKYLILAVVSPDDVTNNQRKELVAWLGNRRKVALDSLGTGTVKKDK